ncbi:MAG TPA: hypothetical protein VFE46_13150 [Pirellulales bacterium]|jgi:hypothetical protein|nr:hypothetical protein [Pirellulales bacterium]
MAEDNCSGKQSNGQKSVHLQESQGAVKLPTNTKTNKLIDTYVKKPADNNK